MNKSSSSPCEQLASSFVDSYVSFIGKVSEYNPKLKEELRLVGILNSYYSLGLKNEIKSSFRKDPHLYIDNYKTLSPGLQIPLSSAREIVKKEEQFFSQYESFLKLCSKTSSNEK